MVKKNTAANLSINCRLTITLFVITSTESSHRFSASHNFSFVSARSSSPLHRNRQPNTTADSRVCFCPRIPSCAAYWRNRRCLPSSALRVSKIFLDMQSLLFSGCGSCRIRESFCPAKCIFLSAVRRLTASQTKHM